MTYNKKDTRIEDDGCEECGSKNAKYDSKLGEKACADCGLVDVNYSPIDNVADSISQGAERQMERVGRGSSPGTSGSKLMPGDLKGVKNKAFGSLVRGSMTLSGRSIRFVRKFTTLLNLVMVRMLEMLFTKSLKWLVLLLLLSRKRVVLN